MSFNEIETGISIANNTLGFVDNVLEKIEKYRKLRRDKTAYLRLIYLETVNNLEVLNTINLKTIKGAKPNDPKISSVLKLLMAKPEVLVTQFLE